MARGHYARALVLAREHLAEFPEDEIVRAALAEARTAWERPAPGDPGSGSSVSSRRRPTSPQ